MSDSEQKPTTRTIRIGRHTVDFHDATDLRVRFGRVFFRAYKTPVTGGWLAAFAAFPATLLIYAEAEDRDLQTAVTRALGRFRRDAANVRGRVATEPVRLTKARKRTAEIVKRADARLAKRIQRARANVPKEMKRIALALEAVR